MSNHHILTNLPPKSKSYKLKGPPNLFHCELENIYNNKKRIVHLTLCTKGGVARKIE